METSKFIYFWIICVVHDYHLIFILDFLSILVKTAVPTLSPYLIDISLSDKKNGYNFKTKLIVQGETSFTVHVTNQKLGGGGNLPDRFESNFSRVSRGLRPRLVVKKDLLKQRSFARMWKKDKTVNDLAQSLGIFLGGSVQFPALGLWRSGEEKGQVEPAEE